MKKRGRENFNKYKSVINLLVLINSYIPKNMNKILWLFFSQTKGLPGILIRYILLRNLTRSCGDNVSVHSGVYIFGIENLSIGNNVSVHPMCYIEANGGVEIGNDVSIAHGVTIMSTTHNYKLKDVPIKDQKISTNKVLISNNVWIGAKSTILCGIKLGSGNIVAAHTLVTKDFINENIVLGGIPAKEIKKR
ncbi:acyltransferase [uncultured Marinococcus sp.]|uniref:acyltransferase n=1 Tax=uncultured Marinococcus sp. TaxID=487012 RepID=UPI00262CE8DA|nr:acyltransferase [uncultured Marinococcus sp.]